MLIPPPEESTPAPCFWGAPVLGVLPPPPLRLREMSRSTKQVGRWGAVISPRKIMVRALGPNPCYPEKPGEEGTGEELYLGRVKDMGVNPGSPSLVSYRLDWPSPTSPSLPWSHVPSAQAGGMMWDGWQGAGRGGTLPPAPSHQGLGGSGNGTLCHSFRSSCTFTSPFLLAMGMPREADGPAHSCPSLLLASSLFLCRVFRKVLNAALLPSNYLSKGGG